MRIIFKALTAGFFALSIQIAFSTQVGAAESTTPEFAGEKQEQKTEQRKPTPNVKTTQSETPAQAAAEPIKVVFETSLGPLLIELYPNKAPISVDNFLQYVDSGFYNGVIFHRVVPNFVVQVGGFDEKYQQKPTRAAIKNESDNGLQNLRGTLSMARTMSPDSATSQFFISLRDNPHLDAQPGRPGYAVFGKVISGMDVVDKLPELPQGNHSGVFMNAPNDPITVDKAYRFASDRKAKTE